MNPSDSYVVESSRSVVLALEQLALKHSIPPNEVPAIAAMALAEIAACRYGQAGAIAYFREVADTLERGLAEIPTFTIN